MKPDAYIPFYGNDFFQALEGYTEALIVGYLRALWHYWHHNHCAGLPDDDDYLRRVCRCDAQNWSRTRGIIFGQLFTIQEGKWHQERARLEYKASCDEYHSAVERAKAGAAARWGKEMPKQCSSNAQALPKQMLEQWQSESESESESKPESEPEPEPSILNRGFEAKSGQGSRTFQALKLANRIIANSDGWFWDNCKVPMDKLKAKPLASVIEPAIGKNQDIGKAWADAVKDAHGAVVDGLQKAVRDPVGYAVACFKARIAV